MRIETWAMKKGDIIKISDQHSDHIFIEIYVELEKDPYEDECGQLCVCCMSMKSIGINNYRPREILKFDDKKNRWLVDNIRWLL